MVIQLINNYTIHNIRKYLILLFSVTLTMGDKSRKNSTTHDVEANNMSEEQQQVQVVAKAVHGHPVSEHPTT